MALITNAAGTYIADVDSGGRQLVKLPGDGTNAGAVFLVGKPDLDSPANTGSITGSSQGLLGTAAVEIDFDVNFAASAICYTQFLQAASSMSVSVANNALVLNTTAATASGNHIQIRTYRSFKAERGADRVWGVRLRLDQNPVANTTVDFGLGIAASTTDPTAGAFFRLNSAGELRGVTISSGGSESTTSVLTYNNPTGFQDFVIIIGRSSVTFFINEVPVGSIAAPANSTGPVSGESFPGFVRLINNTAVGTAQKVYVSKIVSATMGGLSNRDSTHLAALKGDIGQQHVTGVGTGGQTTNWTNSGAPAAATLSNTAAGYTTLGGLFVFVALAGANTDYALFAYQVPAGTLTNMGRTLIVRGVAIDAFVSAAAGIPTVATVLEWGFAFGATAVSLATSESSGTKLPRKGFLGIQAVPTTAVVGTELRRIQQTFEQPVAVNAGEYFHIILRIPAGAATNYPTITGGVFIDASWE